MASLPETSLVKGVSTKVVYCTDYLLVLVTNVPPCKVQFEKQKNTNLSIATGPRATDHDNMY